MEAVISFTQIKEEFIKILPNCLIEDKANDSRKNFPNMGWNKLTWTCYYCQHNFNDYFTYKSHQDSLHSFVNSDDAYYQCVDCDEQPFHYASFLNHVRSIHHEDLKLCCDVCSEILLDYEQLSLHRSKHIETYNNHPAVYHCTLCEIVRSSEKELKNHFKLSHNLLHSVDDNDLIYSNLREENTEPSSKTFQEENFSTELIQCKDEYHDTVLAFQCGKCVNNFASETDLAVHMHMHTELHTIQCKICLENFTDTSNLKRHLQGHNKDRPYECEKCEKAFKCKGDKKVHMRIHTGERPFQCEACQKRFSDYSNFKRHVRDHNEERPHKCEICEKTFKRKGDKNFHMRLHNREQKPKDEDHCKICSKGFTNPSHFKEHMRIHTGERPFQCKICKKNFTSKSILTRHLLTHSDDRPYKCDKCEKQFKRKEDKNVHMRMHTGERPYKCKLCSKEYIVQQNLKVHIDRQHSSKDDPLTICSNIFKKRCDLETLSKSCKESLSHNIELREKRRRSCKENTVYT